VLNLGSPRHPKDEQVGIRPEDCAALATRFETLAVVGLVEVGDGRLTSGTPSAAACALDGLAADTPTSDADEADSVKFVRLAAGVGRRSSAFVQACAETTQTSREDES